MSAAADALANTDELADAVAARETERVATQLSAREAEETRSYVQDAADPETVVIEVATGDDVDRIPCEPIGLGRRARLSHALMAAEESGDDKEQVEAVLGMIDALIEMSTDRYGRDYWDGLQQTEIRDAFRELSLKSAGGEQAGK